jgi:hypothetical protein
MSHTTMNQTTMETSIYLADNRIWLTANHNVLVGHELDRVFFGVLIRIPRSVSPTGFCGLHHWPPAYFSLKGHGCHRLPDDRTE